ncbi:MAG TPA: GPW/gp25 family protein [Bacillota bacterium]|nr:GPW/gp25 family protein [Bacillota bacterium]
MEYVVLAKPDQIDFAPKTEVSEILQNIRTILSTPKFSVPLAREFGVSATMGDDPMPAAMARLTAEIVAAVQKWEPRARVTQVTYEGDGREGVLRPKVRVRIND